MDMDEDRAPGEGGASSAARAVARRDRRACGDGDRAVCLLDLLDGSPDTADEPSDEGCCEADVGPMWASETVVWTPPCRCRFLTFSGTA
jgi:hypothetical protein